MKVHKASLRFCRQQNRHRPRIIHHQKPPGLKPLILVFLIGDAE